jgi:hypothetical protein
MYRRRMTVSDTDPNYHDFRRKYNMTPKRPRVWGTAMWHDIDYHVVIFALGLSIVLIAVALFAEFSPLH